MPKGIYARPSLETRFWGSVTRGAPDECWPWQRGKFENGYGLIGMKSTPLGAHRVSYCLSRGVSLSSIAGLTVRHSCHNPSCVNPEHLSVGTPKQNREDMTSAGRSARGTKQHLAKLTEAEVQAAREIYAAGGISIRKLAKRFCVSFTPMQNLLVGKTWRHVK